METLANYFDNATIFFKLCLVIPLIMPFLNLLINEGYSTELTFYLLSSSYRVFDLKCGYDLLYLNLHLIVNHTL